VASTCACSRLPARRADRVDRPPLQKGATVKTTTYALAATAALGLAAAGFWLWWQGQSAAPVATVTAPVPVPAAAPASQAPAASAAILHPIDQAVAAEAAAPLVLDAALAELFGRKAVLSLFQLQDFPRRFVATVDNLGRTHAPASSWPVNPVGGRFIVERRDGAEIISADNGLRYTPYLLAIEAVDLRRMVALYARLYPQLQQAYEDIGYPNRYFNDRLVEVIDQLLATPEVSGPLKVHLPEIKGPLQPERPWVLYEFDDPPLQALSSGQKTLLRMGPVNQRRIKARLAEIRRLVTAGGEEKR
jgi:Protein of unknown function (DUF3014)